MKIKDPTTKQLCKRVTRNRQYFLNQKIDRKDSFIQLTQWLARMKWPTQNEVYTQCKHHYLITEQIHQLKEYIEISEGIELCKKSLKDKVIFKCKKISQCEFYIEFQLCSFTKNSQIIPHYKVIYTPKIHQCSKDSDCYQPSQQVLLKARKMFLVLIRSLLKQILISNQATSQEKNPSWVMKKLETIRKENSNFMFVDLTGHYKRQLKKAFDNAVLKVKNEINQEFGLTQKSLKKSKKSKKIKKSKKQKVKVKSKQIDIFLSQDESSLLKAKEDFKEAKIEIEMIEEGQFEQKSSNVFLKCFNEVKMQEILEQKSLKEKPESNLYQTPTKNKEKVGFDLENSTQKRRTTYNKSFQQRDLFGSMGKVKKMKSDSDSQERKSIWNPQKTTGKPQKSYFLPDFHISNENSNSEDQAGCFKDPTAHEKSGINSKKKGFEEYLV